MTLDRIDRWLRRSAALALMVPTVIALWGLWRARARTKGRASGIPAYRALPVPVFVLIAAVYSAACVVLWRPIPLPLPRRAHTAALGLGSLIYCFGIGLFAWARLVLGEMYNVSSAFGAELYAGHRLITSGPYAIVRHPMYVAALLMALGGLLIYRNWTLAFIAVHVPVLVVRARREDEALAAEFGAEWEAYRRRVPGWVPTIAGQG